MLKIFYGDDRVRAQSKIKKILGNDYEVIEGAELSEMDLPSIFFGTSLLAEERKILIKDLSAVSENWEKLIEYIDTPHTIIIWEEKLDKRTATYKKIVKLAEIEEFKKPEQVDRGLAFDIYDVALRDGKKAIIMLDRAELTDDPYQIVGAWAWKAVDNFKRYGGAKEKRALKELSRLDINMKTTSLSPWTLLRAFLLQVSSL